MSHQEILSSKKPYHDNSITLLHGVQHSSKHLISFKSKKKNLFHFPCLAILFSTYRELHLLNKAWTARPKARKILNSDWIKPVMTRKQSHTESYKSPFSEAGGMLIFSQAWLTSLNINKQRLYHYLA